MCRCSQWNVPIVEFVDLSLSWKVVSSVLEKREVGGWDGVGGKMRRTLRQPFVPSHSNAFPSGV